MNDQHTLHRISDHSPEPPERQEDIVSTTLTTERAAIALLPDIDDEPDEAAIRTVGPRCADQNGTLTPLFFSDDLVDIGRAKAICGKCQLRSNCLRGALERAEPWGVWGGELLADGRIVTSKRPCGRPPKNPRPPVVIDEYGVVA